MAAAGAAGRPLLLMAMVVLLVMFMSDWTWASGEGRGSKAGHAQSEYDSRGTKQDQKLSHFDRKLLLNPTPPRMTSTKSAKQPPVIQSITVSAGYQLDVFSPRDSDASPNSGSGFPLSRE